MHSLCVCVVAAPPPRRMPPDVMFGSAPVPMSPPFMTGGMGIGTGPGTIHIDNFATGYGRRGGGGNPNYRGGGGGRGGYNPNRRQDEEPKFFPDNDNMNPNPRQNNRNMKDYDERGDRGGYYRNNRDNNQGYSSYNPNFQKSNNYQRQNNSQQAQQQKDLDKLPPRFRKQLQMQQGGGQGGKTSPTPPFLSSEMNGSNPPPSRSPSHTPPPPSHQGPPPPQMGGGGYSGNKPSEEINLRPANLRQFNQAFRPNIPSMLPKSTQIPQQMQQQPRHDYKVGRAIDLFKK